jgi:MYXO-CTERM domain-containing protein
MPRGPASFLRLPALLAPLALAASSQAEAPAAPLTRILTPAPSTLSAPLAAVRHPLADLSGRIPFTVPLPPGVDAASFGLLPVAPGIGAARLAPADLLAFAAAHPDLPLAYAPPLRPTLDASRGWLRIDAFHKATGERNPGHRPVVNGRGVVVGVVDTGLDVRHPDFRFKNGKTRVAWFLNAEAPRGLHPELEAQFGCTDPKQSACAVYDSADIDAMILQGDKSIHDVEGHGTHVASIAAGNGGISTHDHPTYVGVAPEATLVVASPSANGGFFDADVLNGARFVMDRADALGMPVALNLSIGGDFGPHDGTSALERGLSAMVGDDKPGHAVVVAAGNSGALLDVGDGPSSGSHTEARVTPGSVTRVPLRVAGSKKGQGFIWITLRSGDDVDVALEGPGGSTWIGFTGRDSEQGYDDKHGTTAGVVNNHVGKSSTLTSDTNSVVVVVDGAWADPSEFAVLLRGSGEAELWAVGQGDVGGTGGFVFERAVRSGTITVPASAPGLLAVGCTLNRLTWKPLGAKAISIDGLGGDPSPVADGACYFTASGPPPLGVAKPEISAPGGFVIGAMSSEADPRKQKGGLFDAPDCPEPGKPCFLIDDYHAVAAGTSMSAPQVTGAAALLMQIDPTLTQARLTDVLQAGARKPVGHVPYASSLGPGVLDLEGARLALASESLSSIQPDLGKSWYTLSSDYARPDPAWPIWGTIELRRADGSLASGLDGTSLAVGVKNGALVRPLTKVRHGLFRFAVAGNLGAVGEAVEVDVTYAGASLGKRSLPIGTDIWTTDGVVDATAGCSTRPSPTRSPFALAPLALLALARLRRYRESKSIARRFRSKSC